MRFCQDVGGNIGFGYCGFCIVQLAACFAAYVHVQRGPVRSHCMQMPLTPEDRTVTNQPHCEEQHAHHHSWYSLLVAPN